MTGREFSEVDIDLLADYVGGALDGTPDEAVVSALIADDADWRTAHETLAAGMTAVGADLRALGAEAPAMPDDVATRLTAALAAADGAPVVDRGAGRLLQAVPDLDETTPGDAAAHRPGRDRSGATRSGRKRRGLSHPGLGRWAAPVAAAAGVLAFAGFGVQQFWGAGTDGSTQADTASSGAGVEENAPMLASDAPGQERAPRGQAAAPAGVLAAVPAPERITTSDRDYDRAVLRGGETFLSQASPPQQPPPTLPDSDAGSRSSAAQSLPGLIDRQALQSCLQAIAVETGGGPITVDTVDYARFDGAPALIVRFTVGDGRWAWASGPECGSPPGDADTRYRVKVG